MNKHLLKVLSRLIVIFFAFTSLSAQQFPSGLVGHWDIDGAQFNKIRKRMLNVKKIYLVFIFIQILIHPLSAQSLPWGDEFESGNLVNWTIIDDEPFVGGPSNWSISNGELLQSSNIFTTENEYSVFTGTHITSGDKDWTDYYFNVRISSIDDDGIGMLFRYQDPKNYYRFMTVADSANKGPFKRLEKQINGVFTTLAESTTDIYIPGEFIGTIRVKGDSIFVFEGENNLFAIEDNTYSQGKIGLMCYANNNAIFDDVYISEQDTLFQEKPDDYPEILTADRPLSVRVMTFNIWVHGKICTPAQVADLILSYDVDFAGLQECDSTFGNEVARLTGMHLAVKWGNYLYSKTPYTKINNLSIKGANIWTNIDSQTVSVYNFHIGWDEIGDRLARTMVDDYFAKDPVPLQIAFGDFNDEHYSTQITIIEEHMRYCLTDLGWAPSQRVTWPAFDFYGGEGAQTIDLIFCNKTSKGRLVEGEILNLSPVLSDHKPVWGTIEFPASKEDVTPQITKVVPYFGSDMIEIWFDQDLDQESAEDASNYQIVSLDGGNSVTVSQAEFVYGAERIRLHTSSHQYNKEYRVNVTNVKDKYIESVLVNSNKNYMILQNLIENSQAESGTDFWQTSGGFTTVSSRENQFPYLGNEFFTGENLQPLSIGTQEIDLTSWAEQIDAGMIAAEWNCYFATGYEVLGDIKASRCEPYDEGEMLIDFIDENDNILLQASSKRWDALFWHPYGETSYVPKETRKVAIHLISYRKTANGNSNDAAFENAFFSLKNLEEPHQFGRNLLVNPSAESGDMQGWDVAGEMFTRENEIQKTRSLSGSYVFTTENPTGSASQIVDLSQYIDVIDAGTFGVKWGGYMRDFRGDQAGEIEITFYNQNMEPVGSASTGPQRVAEWWQYDRTNVVPPSARTLQYKFKGDIFFDFLHLIPVLSFVTSLEENAGVVHEFKLLQNYPNPFNPTTTIEYSIAEKSNVSLSIFNSVGQQVSNIIDAKKHLPGDYKVSWNANNLASGVYFYRIMAGKYVQVKKLILLK